MNACFATSNVLITKTENINNSLILIGTQFAALIKSCDRIIASGFRALIFEIFARNSPGRATLLTRLKSTLS